MLAGHHGVDRLLRMERIRRADGHDVDVRIREHVIQFRIYLQRNAITCFHLFRRRIARAADRRHFRSGRLVECDQMRLGDPAEPYDTYMQFLH